LGAGCLLAGRSNRGAAVLAANALSERPVNAFFLEPEHAKNSQTNTLLAGLGRNLRRLRTVRGYSLERFSKLSGVSRGMLGQIENGKSMPTIGVLWKIATALDLPFAQLLDGERAKGTHVLRRDEMPVLVSDQGGFQSRALCPLDFKTRTEFYELRLAPLHTHSSEAHAPGTCENLAVISGFVELKIGEAAPVTLYRGDAIFFEADVPHSYRNLEGMEAVLHLVLSYEPPLANLNGGA
jgi:transcriptional regulator with XRE-family HTH domain